MNERVRDLLGEVWRLCDQMSYSAENGYVATLNVQFETLKRYMSKLEELREVYSGKPV